jgi:hypothetical protein
MSAENNQEIMALVIPAQSEPYYKKSTWDLKELREAVGGSIESLPHDFEKTIIYGNDEAKYAGEGGGPLPLNVRATEALKHMLFPGDYIAGNIVVLGNGKNGYEDNVNIAVAESLKSGQIKIVTPEGDLIDI